MENSGAIIVAIIISVMCSLGSKSAAINGDKKLRTNSSFFPKHYTIPPRWIRKLFSLPKRYMANFLVFELYLSLIHIALGFINVVLQLLNFPWSESVCVGIVICTCIWALFDTAIYIVFMRIFSRKMKA